MTHRKPGEYKVITLFNRALRAGAFLVTLVSASIAHAEWWEAETSHFIIVSESSKEDTQRFATELERFDNALRYMQGLAVPGPEVGESNKVRVYRFGSTDDIGRLAGSSQVAGFYIPRAGNAVSFVPAKDDDSDRFDRNLDRRALREKTELTPARILFHEYVHHFMLQNFSTSYPHWYREGFAELYGTLELFDDGTFRIGNVPQHRGEALFALSDVRLTRLFDHNKRLDGQDLYQSYSFGWLLAHYLNFNPERRGQLAAYLKALNAGEDSLTAAKRIFGDLDKLQGELRKYKGGPFPTMDVKPAHYVAPKVVMRQLTAGEEAVMRAHIRSERGVSKREAQQVVDEIDGKDRQYSDNLAVQLITAEAYTDAGEFAKAEAALKRALVIAPESQEANVLMGNMFMARAKKEKDNAVYAQARPWFSEAYRLDPKDPRAAIGYYMTYYQAREAIPEPALIALESVFDYSSYDDGYRLVLARQLLDENKGKLARSVLAPLAFSSHKQAEANKVAEVVDAIDAGQIQDARTTMAAIFAKQDEDEGK
ncbi:tetratricopeptide repeat protein [Sphingopyxis sp. MC1]|uniref:tetratricopeptide repeat protein n=1 Tax=Sphingopyxis sp. MC1 TaxID=1174684 RepID=UPI0002D20D28|nr:tetratricopeptide repeat protein [Sphingopyxis sp. MC1]ENY81950.1 hypothetical protein EBMC1_08175 [Sphingopyxis sp. MC1]